MAKFLSFIHAEQDIEDFRSDFPEHEFVHVSENAIPGTKAVVSGSTFAGTVEALLREHSMRPFAGIVFGSEPELYVKAADRVLKGTNDADRRLLQAAVAVHEAQLDAASCMIAELQSQNTLHELQIARFKRMLRRRRTPRA